MKRARGTCRAGVPLRPDRKGEEATSTKKKQVHKAGESVFLLKSRAGEQRPARRRGKETARERRGNNENAVQIFSLPRGSYRGAVGACTVYRKQCNGMAGAVRENVPPQKSDSRKDGKGERKNDDNEDYI